MILLLSLNKTFRVDLNIRYDGKGFYYDLSVLPHAHFFFFNLVPFSKTNDSICSLSLFSHQGE